MSRASTILTIDDLGYGGRGIARLDGKVVMVSGALPGETVEVYLRHHRRRWIDGNLLAVIDPSPTRRVPACPLALTPTGGDSDATACPGCVYQHADYADEKQFKQRQLETLLERVAGVSGAVDDGAAAIDYASLGYRNKMVHQAQRDPSTLRLGYAAGNRARILDTPVCLLAHPAINTLSREWRERREAKKLQSGDRVTFRHTEFNGALAWVNPAPDNAVWLREHTALGSLAVPRNAFFQVHPQIRECLTAWVRDQLVTCGKPHAVDLYCGVGVFALTAAAAGIPHTLGVDQDGPAIQAADYNARQRGLTSVQFIAQPVSQVLKTASVLPPGNQSVVVVDPPRAGLDAATLVALQRWSPSNILMISCAPDTMCRDLKTLIAGSYDLREIAWFDMFPRTACFETAVRLTRSA